MPDDVEIDDMIARLESQGFLVVGPARARVCPACGEDYERAQRDSERMHLAGCPWGVGGPCSCHPFDRVENEQEP